MGSLASRPAIPAAQAVYMPVYTPAPSSPSAGQPPLPAGQATEPVSGDDEGPQERRTASLLERRRGVLSTVLTGFRGLLNQTATPQRKTLLGE